MSDTPRCDKLQTEQPFAMTNFARSLERELNEAIRKLSYGCASEQDFMDFRNRHYELEKERDQLKAELLKNNSAACLFDKLAAEQDRDKWRDMARELADVAPIGGTCLTKQNALARFNAMEKGKE